jgi:hypothetical protein
MACSGGRADLGQRLSFQIAGPFLMTHVSQTTLPLGRCWYAEARIGAPQPSQGLSASRSQRRQRTSSVSIGA